MNVVGGSIIFFMSWWMCLLVTLPIGVHGQYEDGEISEGTEEGAPAEHMIPKKMVWATIGAVICTVIAGVVVVPLLEAYGIRSDY